VFLVSTRLLPSCVRLLASGVLVCALLATSACTDDAPAVSSSERAGDTGAPPDTIAGEGDDSATTTTTASTSTAASTSTTSAPAPTTSTVPAGGYVSAIEATVVDDPRFDPLEQRITTALDDAGLPGASLLVVQHGEIVEQEAWGEYTLDTRVPIASGSKWLTAAMIMTLVDEGVLALDEPIATYVPQLAGFAVGTITMRQLMSFTSGLVGDNGAPACVTTGTGTLQECAAEILRLGAVRPPGSAFVYGSQHMHVAGAIAEIVTGRSFFDLFDQRIAQPLGMDHTVFFQLRDPTSTTVDHPMPAGGAATTLGDYARFLEMLVHDGVAPDERPVGVRDDAVSADDPLRVRTGHHSGAEVRTRVGSGAGDAVLDGGAADRGRHALDDAAVEHARHHERRRQLGGAHGLGDRDRCGQLHVLGDVGGVHVERAAEQAREREHVVDLVRVVAATGGHHRGQPVGGSGGSRGSGWPSRTRSGPWPCCAGRRR
jgi:CubicO group peptidase (beta-lactamase class C family)